ncbi:MAG: hypothetical protein L6Q59_08625 [Ignavibacteriaceae bacterium]|nr:hypothetical protein [Ignavibacteriaceae bacterium]
MRIAAGVLLLLLTLMHIPYLQSSIYDYPEMKKFSGDSLYNPYNTPAKNWFKANFHAHSKAWGGLTNGRLSEDSLFSTYKLLNYDIIVISNYFKISESRLQKNLFIPNHEHGINVWKRHYLPIGAREVVPIDYLTFQTLSHKQDILERLQETAEVIVVNHPEFMHGFLPEDFRYLTGYHYIEVLNHYRRSFHHWDSALTAGYPAFGLGNDDSHDQTKEDETGRYFTLINTDSLSETAVYSALKKGSVVAVEGYRGRTPNGLKTLEVINDSVRIQLDNPADSIFVISDGGKIISQTTASAVYTTLFPESASYIRFYFRNDSTKFYTNPVIRTESGKLPRYKSEINIPLTVLYKAGVFAGLLLSAAISLLIMGVKTEKLRKVLKRAG